MLVVEWWRDSIERVVPLAGETSIGGPHEDIDVATTGPLAIVSSRDGSWRVRPCSPEVRLDDEPLVEETVLRHGQRIEVGKLWERTARLRFLLGDRARVLDEERHLRTVIDPLSGMLNRRALMAHLARLRPPAALLMIDIDWMKRINDTYGFFGGDTTLRTTCARIRDCVAWPACVGRIGGEEFVVVMPGDHAAAVALAERIRVACEPAIAFEDNAIVATVSIGVAMVGENVLGALRGADEAQFRAKSAGRNRVAS